jgi:RsiW-degrading membrane proteinase PrsW (M82 family)
MFNVLMAAFAPGLALLSFFYLKDRFDSEPISMVVRMFVFGALLVFPIMVLQFTFKEALHLSPFIHAFINAALTEEFFKWFVLYFLAYHHVVFNQHYDGIVYGTAVSLGFASAENVLYLWIHGVDHAILRALLPVSSHALYGVVMGYYLGKAKFVAQKKLRNKYIWYSFLLPVGIHGTYNYILLKGNEWWLWLMIPFMVVLWIYCLRKVKKANYANPPTY